MIEGSSSTEHKNETLRRKPGIYAGLRFSFRMTGYVPFYQNRIKIVRNQNIDKDMGLRYNKFPNDNR